MQIDDELIEDRGCTDFTQHTKQHDQIVLDLAVSWLMGAFIGFTFAA